MEVTNMFRKMRRGGQELSEEESGAILMEGSTGVLAVTGDDGYPYAVPMNYAYHKGKLVFHCAQKGHKIDGIGRSDKVTFCVVGRDRVVARAFATDYRSVIAFGQARVVLEDDARREALEALVRKYSPQYLNEGMKEIKRELPAVCVVEMTIEHMTGKAARKDIADME
jgi:uncharacterized protein